MIFLSAYDDQTSLVRLTVIAESLSSSIMLLLTEPASLCSPTPRCRAPVNHLPATADNIQVVDRTSTPDPSTRHVCIEPTHTQKPFTTILHELLILTDCVRQY